MLFPCEGKVHMIWILLHIHLLCVAKDMEHALPAASAAGSWVSACMFKKKDEYVFYTHTETFWKMIILPKCWFLVDKTLIRLKK